jgi:hypothetical protein
MIRIDDSLAETAELQELADAVRSRSSSEVVRRDGDRVLLRTSGDRMDMLWVLCAEETDDQGQWWAHEDRLRDQLDELPELDRAA